MIISTSNINESLKLDNASTSKKYRVFQTPTTDWDAKLKKTFVGTIQELLSDNELAHYLETGLHNSEFKHRTIKFKPRKIQRDIKTISQLVKALNDANYNNSMGYVKLMYTWEEV